MCLKINIFHFSFSLATNPQFFPYWHKTGMSKKNNSPPVVLAELPIYGQDYGHILRTGHISCLYSAKGHLEELVQQFISVIVVQNIKLIV